jgi:hypothetical protein
MSPRVPDDIYIQHDQSEASAGSRITVYTVETRLGIGNGLADFRLDSKSDVRLRSMRLHLCGLVFNPCTYAS